MKVMDNSQKVAKVFLGGTCAESTWRQDLIPVLKKKKIDFFNPVVPNWNEEAKKIEDHEKTICGVELYVITSEMTGVYSIAEVMRSVYTNPKGTIFVVAEDGFEADQIKSLHAVVDIVIEEGGKAVFGTNFDPNVVASLVKEAIDLNNWPSFVKVNIPTENSEIGLLQAAKLALHARFTNTNNSDFLKRTNEIKRIIDSISQ